MLKPASRGYYRWSAFTRRSSEFRCHFRCHPGGALATRKGNGEALKSRFLLELPVWRGLRGSMPCLRWLYTQPPDPLLVGTGAGIGTDTGVASPPIPRAGSRRCVAKAAGGCVRICASR